MSVKVAEKVQKIAQSGHTAANLITVLKILGQPRPLSVNFSIFVLIHNPMTKIVEKVQMVRSRFKPVATGQKAQMNPLCFGLNIGIEIVPKVLKQSVCYFDFMPTQVLNTNNGKLIKTSQLRKAYFNKPF